MARYNVIGTMSGTSLDGLDIAYCSFEFLGNNWTYKIIEAQTINFPTNLKDNLKSAIELSALDLNTLEDPGYTATTPSNLTAKTIKTKFETNENDRVNFDSKVI